MLGTHHKKKKAAVRYLITGFNGQLGHEYGHFLGHQQTAQPESAFRGLSREELDITDAAAVEACFADFQPEVLINAAAYTQVDKAETETGRCMQINRDGVENLARACAAQNCTLVHFSTDYVFPGAAEDRERYPAGYPENAPLQPVNAYGESKLKGELALQQHLDDFLILRVSWLCGSHGQNFLKTMLRLSESHKKLTIVDDQLGAPTFTFDVVDATERLLAAGARGIFHLGTQGTHSWHAFATAIFEEAGRDIEAAPVGSEAYPTPATRPAFSKLDTQKFESACDGITYDMRTGIRRVLRELSVI